MFDTSVFDNVDFNTQFFDIHIFCTQKFDVQVCPTQVFDIQVFDVQVVDTQIFATQMVDVQTGGRLIWSRDRMEVHRPRDVSYSIQSIATQLRDRSPWAIRFEMCHKVKGTYTVLTLSLHCPYMSSQTVKTLKSVWVSVMSF